VPFHVSRREFELLAERAMSRLPREFTRLMRNVAVVVEDYPSEDDAALTGVPRGELMGVFRGVPHGAQEGFFDIPHPLPDEVALFQRNIEAACDSRVGLVEEIRMTLLHEVGHYFGLSEEDLDEFEGRQTP
jgi:predicted Zn-dependent protease with MMP-like domain